MQNINLPCSCIICRRQCSASSLAAHFRIHLKIKIKHKCLNCDNETFNNKFCSLSCNAIYNNKIRIRSDVENEKISNTLKNNQHRYNKTNRIYNPSNKFIYGPVTRIWFKICLDCNVSFIATMNTSKYCILCRNSRRIKNGIRTNRTHYNGVWLDSNWELLVAQKLDELKIKWSRPNPINWIDSNQKCHKYFSDFYLHDYEIYIDPKNPYRIIQDTEKLNYLKDKIKLIYGDVNDIINYLVGLPGIEPGTIRS